MQTDTTPSINLQSNRDCPDEAKGPVPPALAWQKTSKYSWRSLENTGYTIAAYRVGENILYRPSKAGRFIAHHCTTADEAKTICANNFILTFGLPD